MEPVSCSACFLRHVQLRGKPQISLGLASVSHYKPHVSAFPEMKGSLDGLLEPCGF